MKIEDQCVSLESAKKLSELGVKAESYFKWCWLYRSPLTGRETTASITSDIAEYKGVEYIPAYTIAELLNMLQQWRDACMCELLLSDINADYLAGFLIELLSDGRVKAEDLK